jgi:hypothetical protein
MHVREKRKYRGFTDQFFLENCTFSSTGENRFFILKPYYQQIYAGEEDGVHVENIITVTNKTKMVDGIETRVIEERATEDGELVEISTNYFAFCEQTNSAFYFGEDVDMYEGGVIVSHEGSWLAGKDGAKAGLFMSGLVLLNSRYQEETAPGVALDRAWILSMTEQVQTPAGDFNNVTKIREDNPVEQNSIEYKFHAPGVGMVQDDQLKLVKYGFTS